MDDFELSGLNREGQGKVSRSSWSQKASRKISFWPVFMMACSVKERISKRAGSSCLTRIISMDFWSSRLQAIFAGPPETRSHSVDPLWEWFPRTEPGVRETMCRRPIGLFESPMISIGLTPQPRVSLHVLSLSSICRIPFIKRPSWMRN